MHSNGGRGRTRERAGAAEVVASIWPPRPRPRLVIIVGTNCGFFAIAPRSGHFVPARYFQKFNGLCVVLPQLVAYSLSSGPYGDAAGGRQGWCYDPSALSQNA